MSLGVAESLLALCFGNLDAIDSSDPLGHSSQEKLDDFEKWVLVDLLVSRFPDVGRPTLRFEVKRLTAECGGDPLELLHSTATRPGTSSDWSHRFPLGVFVEHNPAKQEVGFDIADCHLHSGASIPLPVFFSALASTAKPVDKAQLANKTLISGGGVAWDLGVLLAGARWALWWLRWVRDGGDVHHVKSYVDDGFNEEVVTSVLDGSYWECVRKAATDKQPGDPFPDNLDSGFTFNGLCNIQRIFWRVLSSPTYDFPGRRSFFLGLVRACVGISSLLSARPGDGLSRFVDRFEEMGLTRDAALGELRNELLVPTLRHVAVSDDVVGAEFRKTVTGKGRGEFKEKIRNALSAHHSAFAKFVKDNGNGMALSMPVGFLRRPLSDTGGGWTDLLQLREACYGVEALKQILRADDDGKIAKAIWATDVAGDEFGSASWPFAAAAELMLRQGVELEYAIHAGEAFASPLNGIRRIGELYLADRFPDRIGHALALSPTASAAVCSGETPPPIRIGDAICDLAWAWDQGCGSEVEARGLMSRLTADASGHGLPPEAWRDAYKLLFDVDALIEHGVIVRTVSEYSAGRQEDLEGIARRSESDVVRALTALVCGVGPQIYVDVKAPVPADLREPLANFDRAAAPSARTLVADLVRTHSVIEVCPSSNLRLANLDGLENHPVWRWKEEGIDVVVGSDDPLIFGATIADEFAEMLSVKNRATVMQIAAEGVKRCSGKERRKLPEFETVARRTA